ncbi:MAG: DUF3793 family protein [Terrisporobacter sp.]|uniref:DUF3793 family protein n=1 Tax=Terrisporobacter sp. TaxID=1965305 RepID=UPI002FC740C1
MKICIEVGLFLGYRFEDVKDFIFNKGKNYKLSGCWKAYHNEKHCEEIFLNYKKCKSNNLRLFNMKFSLESLIYIEL